MSEPRPQDLGPKIFSSVEKPGRYTGGEWNEIRKDPRQAMVKIALIFPDIYEIGMSHLGQKILYFLINGQPSLLAERVFSPWPDYEQALRAAGLPLHSLENKIPLADFDLLGFSLLYELNYSNILTILDLGRVPWRSSERSLDFPLVIAGGPAAFNPEPVADIFDAFLIGDGEEAVLEIVEALVALKKETRNKNEILAGLARIEGVYVPSLYDVHRSDHSFLLAVKPKKGAPFPVRKRVLSRFSQSNFPDKIIVPNIQAVFDRVAVEVARGCPQKCRFCQATSLYAPYRVKDPSFVIRKTMDSLRATGYEDASLFSLSVGDYPYLEGVVESLMKRLEKDHVSLSLSSLRPKKLSEDIVQNIIKVRKTGFTLVPEAGSERLRRVINKNLNDRDIWEAAETAFRQGWKLLKLYFMIGLPTETGEDLAAIPALVQEVIERGRKILKAFPRINLSLSSFIPKPHTPFQWRAMDDEQTLREKQAFLKSNLRKWRSVEIKDHPVRNSALEAIFSRGDRRLNVVLHRAWEKGARFDSWRDHFRFDVWEKAFEEERLDYHSYLGEIDRAAALPWDHIQTGMKKEFLINELEKALRAESSPSCLDKACGRCRGCDYWPTFEKNFKTSWRVQLPERTPLGLKTEAIYRYQAFYAKQSSSRFIGHNDLINILQRSFRRAGLDAIHTAGFHPKMGMSFVPALPLGMEGAEESFEFRSSFDIAEEEFVRRLNENVPAGIRFRALKKIKVSAPSLTDRIQSLIYSLDLNSEEAAKALEAVRFEKSLGAADLIETAEVVVRDFLSRPHDFIEELAIDREKKKLFLRLRSTSQKSIRPQDVIEQLFGLKNAVYSMTRERIIFKI
jgi:radical SAM family uncharacterized protein/radical SAM-linked protein